MTEKVQLFVTCLVDTLYPQVGEAVVHLLRRGGVQVDFPASQTCCGQPAFNAGMRAQARQMAEHTIQVFENTSGAIVTPSGSCAAMIRHGYPELFAGDPLWLTRANSLAERSYEFTEYLVDYLGITDVGARYASTLTYHPSCHILRGLGVDHQPLALLSAVQGSELVQLPYAEECCGFGGVFSLEHPEVSAAMLERKLENIEASASSLVVACDAGCIANINGGCQRTGRPFRAVHIAEILAGS
jgi:L-lactate dehydrogenase complex protein LldE